MLRRRYLGRLRQGAQTIIDLEERMKDAATAAERDALLRAQLRERSRMRNERRRVTVEWNPSGGRTAGHGTA